MAEQSNAIGNEPRKDAIDIISDMASQVRSDIDQFVEGIEVKDIAKRVEDFGRENPVGLALTALSIGIVAGLLMRNPGQLSRS